LDERQSAQVGKRGNRRCCAPEGEFFQLEIAVRAAHGLAPITDAEKRRDIAKGRKLIEKRNRVKDWLESLGADLEAFGKLSPAENALFFVFDRMQARELPSIA